MGCCLPQEFSLQHQETSAYLGFVAVLEDHGHLVVDELNVDGRHLFLLLQLTQHKLHVVRDHHGVSRLRCHRNHVRLLGLDELLQLLNVLLLKGQGHMSIGQGQNWKAKSLTYYDSMQRAKFLSTYMCKIMINVSVCHCVCLCVCVCSFTVCWYMCVLVCTGRESFHSYACYIDYSASKKFELVL